MSGPQKKATGTVGVIGMDTGRFTEFSLALGRLNLPDGWQIMGALNYDENHARNFLADNFEGDWLWFIDDDHGFHPDTLLHLLARAKREHAQVVAPLVTQRRKPFKPVAIKDGFHLELDGQAPDVIEVDMTGTAGMLIHRDVFAKLEKPYFYSRDDEHGEHWPSDTNFCKMLGKAGVPIWVDQNITLSHFNVFGVVPVFTDGQWVTAITISNEPVFAL